jgi:hypothetical protein
MERNNNNRAHAANPAATVQRLIQISQKLVDIGDRETQALLQRDITSFSIIQDEKESVAGQYTKASEEFRARLEDFRSVEKGLLIRLENLQKNIAEKARSNNVMILQIKERAETSTQKTLLMAQEFGQQKRTRFGNDNKQEGA